MGIRGSKRALSSARKPFIKDRGESGDRESMVAIQALVTAITFTLVLVAVRLTIELEALDRQ